MSLRIYNPSKATRTPNPVKAIEKQEKKPVEETKPKAQEKIVNQSERQLKKDERITIVKPKFTKF